MAKRKPLAEAFPELAKEAHGWDPTQIHDLTNEKKEWICKKGHTWLAFTYTRTGKNPRGCPVCANKSVAVGSNDLKSQFPKLAAESDGWDPKTVSIGTQKKLSWKCANNHKWMASVANRISGTGCPFCSNNKVFVGFNDLATTHPEISAEANGWDPTLILSGTAKKLDWKCSKGHIWKASVNSRAGKLKTGCPYCSGRLVIEGETDLKTLFPKIAAQAHGWDPSKVNAGSKSKLEFQCAKGHIYKTPIADRTSRGSGCSVCSNKIIISGVNDLGTTHPAIACEAFGWDPTKIVAGSNKHFDWKCKDGHKWNATANHRTGRNQGCPYCSGARITLGKNDLKTTHPVIAAEADAWDTQSVSAGSNAKLGWKCSLGHKWNAVVAARTGKLNTGCPVCSNNKVETGFNDLATKFPEIAREADGWDPSKIGAGSNKKFAWKCKLNHQWNANVSSRTSLRTGCPVCANLKVQLGFNDLATTHPEIAREAYGWDPKTVAYGSASKLRWQCSNGHIYTAPPIRRTSKNTGCSICANKVLLVGFNDLATTHPDLAKEAFGWDPSEVNAGRGLQKSGKTNQKRKWKCSLGHIWEATPSTRTSSYHQSGCPICSGNQLLVGFNDLATTHPDLAPEAFGWDPQTFVSGGKEKKKWKCAEKGHIWKVSISERKSGSGCPSCAQSGFDPNKDGWLYFMEHPDWEMFQIGITNVPDDRLAIHKRLGWQVLELRGPMNGDLARQWETDILRLLRKKDAAVGNTEIAGRFTGYTESWIKASFPVNSLKELMNLVKDNE
ncbi:MAG: zinc-ribbon domain-containing protein [Actinomycetota bacterium]|nr:zinc-ribbon domain-containing protein [Actinomycetota bacterium]